MTTASAYSAEMAMITGNTGGNIQQLPPVTTVGSRKRNFVATIALASQAAGSKIAIARLPKGAIITSIMAQADTSLGSATLAFGDVNAPAQFGPAATLTTTETRVAVGPPTAMLGVPLNGPLYDAVTGNVSLSYEDVVITTAAAALPASGTLKIIFDYAID